MSTATVAPFDALVPAHADDDAWLSVRNIMRASGAISASEVPKIMGLSKWGDASTVADPASEAVEPTFAMRAGLAMEAAILAMGETEHGLIISRCMPRLAGCTRASDSRWLVASLDAVVLDGEDRWLGPIDAKFVHPATADSTLLREYGLQVETQAYVTRCDRGWLLAMKGNEALSLIEVDIDHDRYERQVLPVLRRMHEVRTGARPFDPAEYPFGWGTFGNTTATPGKTTTVRRALIDRLAKAKARVEAAEQAHDAIANEVRAALGDAETGTDRHGLVLVTYKGHERTSLDTKRLRADHPDLVDAYSTTVPYRQLLLTKSGKRTN